MNDTNIHNVSDASMKETPAPIKLCLLHRDLKETPVSTCTCNLQDAVIIKNDLKFRATKSNDETQVVNENYETSMTRPLDDDFDEHVRFLEISADFFLKCTLSLLVIMLLLGKKFVVLIFFTFLAIWRRYIRWVKSPHCRENVKSLNSKAIKTSPHYHLSFKSLFLKSVSISRDLFS